MMYLIISKFQINDNQSQSIREVEHYAYDQQTSMGRRDRRSGQQTGTLTHVGDGVQVDIKWGDPYAGKGFASRLVEDE